MSPRRNWARLLFALVLAAWLAGCAQPALNSVPNEDGVDVWSGRIALQVQDQPSQSFAALFELRGNAQSGELALTNPLGNRLAQLNWKDGHAQLTTGQETRTSDSLDTLLQDITGTRIPAAALFDWLKGLQTAVPGWQSDLSALPQGRIVAHREDPTPSVTLRIALTR